MVKILVTGGLGFIGFNLSCKLLQKGYKVIILDALKRPAFPNIIEDVYKSEKIEILNELGAEIIIGDCNDKNTTEGLLIRYKPEFIFHLASLSIAGVANYNPIIAKNDIFDATFNLLHVLKSTSIQPERFFYLSSSMVYGNFLKDKDGNILPAKEEQICTPICVYGTFKYFCEIFLQTWHKLTGLKYNVIRTSAVYGPYDNNKRVVETFIENAIRNKPLLVENEGKHKLDFTYIDDLTEGLLLMLEKLPDINEVFNISGGREYSINELAMTVKKFFPEVKIEYIDSKPYRPNRGALDISKAINSLGYKPNYTLEKGIEKYIDFFKKKK